MAKNISLILLLCACMLTAFAQKTQEIRDPEGLFKQAELLFDMKNYHGARGMLDKYLNTPEVLERKNYSITDGKARFYLAVCAFELYSPDAEILLTNVANIVPETPYTRMASFHLGRFYFRERKYKDAIEWYKKVDTGDLDREERNEYNFQLAYCYFFNKEFKEALPLFKQTKDVSNKYYYPSNYYYGYILFLDGDYDKALASFEKIKESAIYQKIIPYYISQIYFHKKQYQQTVDYLKPLVSDQSQKYYAELNQLMGQALFELGKYDEALPYLEVYAKGRTLRKEEAYQLGFVYHKTGEYTKSLERLEKLDNLEDTIGQSALFILGDDYLKTGNKANARAAFMKASRLAWDKTITENATFQYGKLSYETGFDAEATKTLQTFVTTYPTSKNRTEAQELMADLFLNSNDYNQALQIIETIQDKSPKVKKAYQAVAYSRGLQLFNESKYDEALRLFDVSLTNPIDASIKALCYYWKGEAWYTLGEYQKANWQYPNYLTEAASNNIPDEEWLTITANYGNGYSYLKRKMYDEAASSLERSVTDGKKSNIAEVKNKVLPDAELRLADSYFMLKKYDKAVANYDDVVSRNVAGKEYALYQKGFIQGLQGNNQGKIAAMLQVVQLYPKGTYGDDALFQAGSAYLEEENSAAAVTTLTRLVNEYPTSPFVTKAYLTMALSYYNKDEWSKANEYYNNILDKYPNSEDAKQAFNGKKDLAIASGKDTYINDRKSVTKNFLTASDAEKLSYDIAFKQFVSNSYADAAARFTDYLTGYNKGVYIINAHYYRAASNYNIKKQEEALPDYVFLLDNKPNDYIEESALRAAQISYEKKKDYKSSNLYFQQLLAVATQKENVFVANVGLMRTAALLGNIPDAAKYAASVLGAEQASAANTNEANFYLAKQAFNTKDYVKATEFFKKVENVQNAFGAEAQYRLALMENLKGNFEGSNKLALDAVNKIANYVDWVARTYILLGDNYAALNNYFQAKSTFESVIENYDGTDTTIPADAKQKLEKVKKVEESKGKYNIDTDTSGTLQEDPNLKLDLNAPTTKP